MHITIPGRQVVPPRRLLAIATAVLAVLAASLTAVTLGARPAAASGPLYGVDVSHYQGSINWTSVRNAGIRFAYIKATEGTSYTDPRFDSNYPNAYYAGIVRGAYHFALPNKSSGYTQANFFVNNGGAWSADNRTLPGALDIEYNPYGGECYGKSHSGMISWVKSFINRYHYRTSRWPVIYTTTDWWKTCTGNYSGFWDTCPLWIARYSSSPGTLPSGAPYWTFWQYTSSGSVPGISGGVDRDKFNGSWSRLEALANNTP